jgi:hypothetical protein
VGGKEKLAILAAWQIDGATKMAQRIFCPELMPKFMLRKPQAGNRAARQRVLETV